MTVELIVSVVFSAVAAVCAAVCLVVTLLKTKKSGGTGTASPLDVESAARRLEESISWRLESTKTAVLDASRQGTQGMSSLLVAFLESEKKTVDALAEQVDRQLTAVRDNQTKSAADINAQLERKLEAMATNMRAMLAEVRADNEKRLAEVRADNEKQLEKMRATVDEKLSETLDKRVQNAFKLVSDRLDSVQKGFGEMQQLTAKVGDLNRIFADVKKRGNWGEVALQSLFEQILSPEQYEVQFRVSPRSQEAVDFAVVLPGQTDESVYLPIDAKFPLEDYSHLVDASEEGDKVAVELARKRLLDRVKSEAKSIAAKYIKPPRTTNFAVMYVPSEGLYAEIMREGAFVGDLQAQCGVTVCGPSTVVALLNSLQVGFTTLKIQKQSGEMLKLMVKVKRDFGKFTELIHTVKVRAESVVKAVDDIDFRNQQIVRKLDKFEDIEPQLPEAAASVDAPTEGEE